MAQDTCNFVQAMLDSAKKKEETKAESQADRVDMGKIESITENIRQNIQRSKTYKQ